MTDELNPIERIPVYDAEANDTAMTDSFEARFGNMDFRCSRMTWLSLFFLLIVYPGVSLAFMEDPSLVLGNLNAGMLMVLLVSTIVMQWGIFLVLYMSLYLENTGLTGLGFKRIRGIDFAWAISFLVASNMILAGLAWFLAQVGLPMPGEIAMLIPTDTTGRIVWVLVSFTAGFCEESMFRGYIMTRLRLVGRFKSWVIPTIASSLAFGACHAYQGLPGLIVITTYGLLFALLYIRTGSIWPCIIAHFFQDFSALFIPQ
ncbi:MAG: CPBP family intramembrane metalloprotease [candidate division Zixibacteria bacterium]|nr:CPBP family intramembrane metalloprotease [candidate division Zixibacteria bacterium]